jgi:uncharacterized membrane protein YfcA
MDILIIPVVAAIASMLTFFSGFGLGTILTPVFAVFFPVDLAVALTAIVHLLNNLFKLSLVGKHADKRTILEFGLPAILAAFVGAWMLTHLADTPPIATYHMFGRELQILWIKLVIATLMIGFTIIEILPRFKNIVFDQKYLRLGGLLSGFFGGLSGHQGALRSAFLTRMNLSKEAFIGTGVVIACMIDVARLGIYSKHLTSGGLSDNLSSLIIATLAAFVGAYIGSKFLNKITMDTIQVIVAAMLFLLAIALGVGFI